MTAHPLVARLPDMRRWDPKSFRFLSWQWPDGQLATIDRIGKPRREPVKDGLVDGQPAVYGSITFGGEVIVRTASRLPSSARVARPGDLVFSKIDARNGAFGVVPPKSSPLCFSTEFPIYDLSASGLRTEFLQLLCRTRVFRSQMAALASGHSGRRRVSIEGFEALQVPHPPDRVQARVLDWYEGERSAARRRQAAIATLRSEASRSLLQGLGVEVPPLPVIARPFAVAHARMRRWSPKHAVYAALALTEEIVSTYPVVLLASHASVTYGVAKDPSNRPADNPRPYLRVANVQADFVDLREVKLIDIPPAVFPKFKLADGDLLLCEGNSLQLVGRPALWRGEIAECAHQNHVLRVRLDRDHFLPEYVVAYMNSLPARRYFLRRAKKTTNLATINSSDVKSLPIPKPPIPIQAELVRALNSVRAQIARLTQEVLDLEAASQEALETVLASGLVEILPTPPAEVVH